MEPDKSLADKAVSIKGKQYVLVSDRVLFFNEHYPSGSITTELLSKPEDTHIVIKATVYPGNALMSVSESNICKLDERSFTGHSQAIVGEGMVNKTAALENAETSAVGRALAMMGIGVIESIASADEVNKATSHTTAPPKKEIGSTGSRTPGGSNGNSSKGVIDQEKQAFEDISWDTSPGKGENGDWSNQN